MAALRIGTNGIPQTEDIRQTAGRPGGRPLRQTRKPHVGAAALGGPSRKGAPGQRTARRVVAPHGASGFGDKRADDIRPYRVSSYPPVARGTPALRRHGTDGGPAGQVGTARQLSGLAGWSMRAAQGAAAPVTKPKKEPGVDARPVLALSVQLSAAMNPRIGGSRVGEAPRPFFPPISSGRNGGARRAGTRREAGPPPDGRILSAPTGLAVGVPRWAGPHPGDTPVSGQKSAPPGIRAALVFTALRGNTPNQGWQAAACRGCCAGR